MGTTRRKHSTQKQFLQTHLHSRRTSPVPWQATGSQAHGVLGRHLKFHEAVPRMRKLFLCAVQVQINSIVSETVSISNPCSGTYYLAQKGGEVTILLFQSPRCWDSRCVPSELAPNQILNNVHINFRT